VRICPSTGTVTGSVGWQEPSSRSEQFQHQLAPTAIDDVLGLDDMAVHRRQLILARDHDFSA
jgi:hypothetical protein